MEGYKVGLVLQYVQEPKGDRGIFRYRRRVTAELKPYIGKGELIASLGSTKAEALKLYPSIHAAFEKQISDAQRALVRDQRRASSSHHSKLELYLELMEEVRTLGVEYPELPPQGDDDSFMRSILAEGIAAKYPEDPETGEPMISDPSDILKITALMAGAPRQPAPTLEDAMKVYVAEKLDGTDFEFRKKLRRVERIMKEAHIALDPMPTLDRWTRETAKKVSKHYVDRGLKPASVMRELNTLKGMISCFIIEKEAKFTNPFANISLPKSFEAPSELRIPMPDDIKRKIRADIMEKANRQIQAIWRLLDGTGARIAEISGLRVQDVVTTGDLPHIKITAHPLRRLKTASSERELPLVADALEAATEALLATGEGLFLFPRYIKATGPTTVSAVIMKRIRDVTTEPKITVHSLRHGMSDRIDLAETSLIDKNAILGHLNPGTGEKHYGGRHAKLRILTRVMMKVNGLPIE